MKKIKLMLLSMFFFYNLSGVAWTGDIIQDQYDGFNQINYHSPIGQSFTAEDSKISSIGIGLEDMNPSINSFSLTMELFRGEGFDGPSLGSVDFTVGEGFSGIFDVDFSFVSLVVGETYTFQLIDPSIRWGVRINYHTYGGDGSPIPGKIDYTGGDAFLLGNIQDTGDLQFRILSVPLFPGEVNLPKTGQTTCYDENGNVIDCINTGQDGDIQAGIEWPSPRFKDNGDGTLTDKMTGLMWLQDANCFGIKTWEGALDVVADFNANAGSYSCTYYTATYTDWVLPNIVELESLVNPETYTVGWLSNQGFFHVQKAFYWSSTTTAYYPLSAWILSLYNYVGQVAGSNKNADEIRYVWPVRLEQ